MHSAAPLSRCPKCGVEVACGAAAFEASEAAPGAAVRCWCMDWPRLQASARLGANACLCPACLRAALREAGRDLRGTRIAVQGFGKVGGLAAQFLHDAGCTVVAVSDVKGGVYNSRGLNPVALLRTMKS